MTENTLDPELLMHGYSIGIFPMAESRFGEIRWFEPEVRGVLELDNLRISRSLRKTLASGRFRVSFNIAFTDVIAACADRDETWISSEIQRSYEELHRAGRAHSVEVWSDGALVGGLYGVAVGGVFAGESMFHKQPDASKVALVFLVRRLRERGFRLIDCQFVTDHLMTLGAHEITQSEYLHRLMLLRSLPIGFADPEERSGWLELNSTALDGTD